MTRRTLSYLLTGFLCLSGGMVLQKYHLPGALVKGIKNRAEMHKRVLAGEREVTLSTRRIRPASAESDPEVYETVAQKIDLKNSALILIDVWESHPNKGWLERSRKVTQDKIAPLLELARENGLTVIHAKHEGEIDPTVEPLKSEVVLPLEYATSKDFDAFLRERGITTLLYAGYSLNICVLHRPVGIIEMSNLNYRTILVRDATLALETPETLSGEWLNKSATTMVEAQWGTTTTLDELRGAMH